MTRFGQLSGRPIKVLIVGMIPVNFSDKRHGTPAFVPVPEACEHAFAFSQFVEKTFHFRWHYHREVELVWIRKGKGLRHVGHSLEAFGDGDLVMVGSNLPHTWCSGADQCGDAEWSVIQFLPERWGGSFWQMAEATSLQKLLKRAECGLRFTGKETKKIGDLMESIGDLQPYSFKALSVFVEICSRLLDVEHELLDVASIGASGFCSDQRLHRVLNLIEERLHDRLSQADLAGEVDMPSAAFSRWFKQHMGRTFQRYVNEVRVARVCAHLAQREENNITEVAMNCGYHNLANFNRRFREIRGVTPKSFRTQARLLQMNRSNRLLAA